MAFHKSVIFWPDFALRLCIWKKLKGNNKPYVSTLAKTVPYVSLRHFMPLKIMLHERYSVIFVIMQHSTATLQFHVLSSSLSSHTFNLHSFNDWRSQDSHIHKTRGKTAVLYNQSSPYVLQTDNGKSSILDGTVASFLRI
jgi:hypothetical protein